MNGTLSEWGIVCGPVFHSGAQGDSNNTPGSWPVSEVNSLDRILQSSNDMPTANIDQDDEGLSKQKQNKPVN